MNDQTFSENPCKRGKSPHHHHHPHHHRSKLRTQKYSTQAWVQWWSQQVKECSDSRVFYDDLTILQPVKHLISSYCREVTPTSVSVCQKQGVCFQRNCGLCHSWWWQVSGNSPSRDNVQCVENIQMNIYNDRFCMENSPLILHCCIKFRKSVVFFSQHTKWPDIHGTHSPCLRPSSKEVAVRDRWATMPDAILNISSG